LQIIATRGSRRFTAQLLAAEVGLTGGAIYRHFKSMDAIVNAVVDRVGSILFEGFPPQSPDPIERLKAFFYSRARTVLGNPCISRLLLSDHLAQAGDLAQSKRLDEFKRRSQTFVSECLSEARDSGLLADGMSPRAGAIIVLGSILAISHADARIADGAQPERLFDDVWFAIERMLRRPQSSAKTWARASGKGLKSARRTK